MEYFDLALKHAALLRISPRRQPPADLGNRLLRIIICECAIIPEIELIMFQRPEMSFI